MNNNDDDDFFTDDLGDGEGKKKRRNGKKKGSRTELGLVKVLTERFGQGFSRAVGSGNRWGQVSYLPKHAQDVFSGDLVVPKHFKWVIESKGGYEGIDLNSILVCGNSELSGFLDQVTKDSKRCGRKPMLCWKRDRKPWLAFVHTTELEGHQFVYSLRYGKWTGVDLKQLLKLDDEFFFDQNMT